MRERQLRFVSFADLRQILAVHAGGRCIAGVPSVGWDLRSTMPITSSALTVARTDCGVAFPRVVQAWGGCWSVLAGGAQWRLTSLPTSVGLQKS